MRPSQLLGRTEWKLRCRRNCDSERNSRCSRTECRGYSDHSCRKQKIELGSSVSSAAYLSQDVPEGQQSDTLDAIKDGKKEIGDNNSGGANPTCWSNWATRNTDPTSEITFRYATQQRVGKIVVYYSKDNGTMTFPREGRTKLFVSETGDEGSWKELSVEETIAENESPERVKHIHIHLIQL